MFLQIPRLLLPDELRSFREALAGANWIDGRATAGHQSMRAKHNAQLGESDPAALALGERLLTRLEQCAQFMSAALPLRIVPPLFNRYLPGEQYGRHIDGAVRSVGPNARLRTDLSATLFLSEPAEYEGGELIIETPSGEQSTFKLAAGELLLYPGTSVHRVAAVRSGARFASFFWIQSLVRNMSRRQMLYALDQSIQRLTVDHPDHPSLIDLTGHYHNLIREWADV